jgi:hypothetical protein
VVGPVDVVVVDVLLAVALEAGEADVQVAGDGGSPAFLEDQAMQRFESAVGLGRPAWIGVWRTPSWASVERKSSERNSPPLSVSTRSSRQPCGGELGAAPASEP